MTDKLPTKLGKEPLIDALFELRFTSSISVSNVLPGFLFSKLQGCENIERLASADLPKSMRDSDPNLQFAPLVRLHWKNFFIAISDRSLVISCKLPYPGWGEFKPAILEVVNAAMECNLIQDVHRFSMKYVDLLPSPNIKEQISLINGSVTIGNHTLQEESFSLRLEVPKGNFFHIVNVISSASATLADGSKKDGIVVDIDTIAPVENKAITQWVTELPDKLDSIHAENKKMFFECLRPGTIASLEPEYE